jgi:hypothetical protein
MQSMTDEGAVLTMLPPPSLRATSPVKGEDQGI